MGNVLAASALPPPPLPPTAPATDSTLFPLNKSGTNEDLSSSLNPGTIEELHKKCKDVFPVIFEGGKLMLNKGLSNHFQISHTINMSSITPSGYRFGATYVGTKQLCPTEAYPVLLGDIDPSGNLNANIIHRFNEKWRAKLATQVQRSKFTGVQMTSDYFADSYTFSLTLGNPDVINASGVLVMHYLKSLTPSLALGVELAYQKGSALPHDHVAILSGVARYIKDNSTITASVGSGGCHFCFHQKASEELQIGVELDINPRMQESVGTIAYQVDVPKADVVFRGSVDTNWTIGAVLEKKLQPLPFSFALSGILNHNKQQFRLGCGLFIG